ncbi:hypothetical protein HAX54_021120 [Datura stramonium]|uniref:Uncharacterized protein n=1 Tax=Datura stramonium TaxID=4076 RepID=A0ABS8S354_DATST|nr:hypothetical protein [Datura stramonium]
MKYRVGQESVLGKEHFKKIYASKALKRWLGCLSVTGVYECCSQVDPKIAIGRQSNVETSPSWEDSDDHPHYEDLMQGMFVANERMSRDDDFMDIQPHISTTKGKKKLAKDEFDDIRRVINEKFRSFMDVVTCESRS